MDTHFKGGRGNDKCNIKKESITAPTTYTVTVADEMMESTLEKQTENHDHHRKTILTGQ